MTYTRAAWVRAEHNGTHTLAGYVYVQTATSRRKAKIIGYKQWWILILIPETV